MQSIKEKAEYAFELYTKHGLVNGLHMGFRASGTDPETLTVTGYEGQSDAAYYTGLALGAECQALLSGVDSSRGRIEEIVNALHHMQKLHGSGLITRNIQPDDNGPDDWVLTGKTRWQGFLTWDQITSVMWGYSQCKLVWEILTPNTRAMIAVDVLAIAEHFDKYGGFRGHQTNLSSSPSHVSFLWKHIMRIFTKERWSPDENNRTKWYHWLEDQFNWYGVNFLNFCVFKPAALFGIYPKKSHILFTAMIWSTAYKITGDLRWKVKLNNHSAKWINELDGMPGTEAMDTKFGKWFSRMAYRLKNKTFSVPSDINYDGNHVKSGISNTLEMLALHSIVKGGNSGTTYLELFERKWDTVSYTECPFFDALYEDIASVPQEFTLKSLTENMVRFRGPNYAYFGPSSTQPKLPYMKYTGKVQMMPEHPVPQDSRDYHGSWSQSGPYSHATSSATRFGSFGQFLFTYFWGKKRNLFD